MASAILQNHSFYTIGLGLYNDLYINARENQLKLKLELKLKIPYKV